MGDSYGTKILTLAEAFERIARLEKILRDEDADAPPLGRQDPPPPKPLGCVCPPTSEKTCLNILCPRLGWGRSLKASGVPGVPALASLASQPAETGESR